jgi:hypothetical protein
VRPNGHDHHRYTARFEGGCDERQTKAQLIAESAEVRQRVGQLEVVKRHRSKVMNAIAGYLTISLIGIS